MLFEDGAFSLAWGADGTVAYFKGLERDFRVDKPYPGTVMVRPSFDADPTPWISCDCSAGGSLTRCFVVSSPTRQPFCERLRDRR